MEHTEICDHQAVLTKEDGVYYLTFPEGKMIFVNKDYPLPPTYGDGITAEMQAALDRMADAAERDGIYIWGISGFRSYDEQKETYDMYTKLLGADEVDRRSAKPGHSEHQTGLAVDIGGEHGGDLKVSFGKTPEFAWLDAHAAEFGLILRYPDGKEWATGFMYEPWHFRYVGVDLAQKLKQSGLSVEEYIGKPHGKI